METDAVELAPTSDDALDVDLAWRLFKKGKWERAFAGFEELIARKPDDVTIRLRYGSALAHRRLPAAETHLRHALSVEPDNVDVLNGLASFLAQERRWLEAEELFNRALAEQRHSLAGLLGLARLHSKLSRNRSAYALFAEAAKLHPDSAEVFIRFSAALSQHAIDMADRAAELDGTSPRAQNARAVAYKAAGEHGKSADVLAGQLAGEPHDAVLQNRLGAARALQAGGRRRRPSIWPRQLDGEDYESVVRKYVIADARPTAPVINSNSKVITLGSCFAEHLANTLREWGVEVFFQKRSENFDNLLATQNLVDWVTADDGMSNNPLFASYGPRESMLARFCEADAIILSLGVSAAYFSRETGEFVMPSVADQDRSALASANDFRMLTLEENLGSLRRVVERLRTVNPSAAIVLTVSPVPLAATFDRASAVQADAVSKSTLRLTVEHFMAETGPDVFYWPSFEVVKWLGAHAPRSLPPIFGADDGASRHVSRWVVRMVIRLFLERFGEGFDTRAPAV